MAETEPAFTYAAEVIRWVDGDTVDVSVDLGFRTYSRQRLRLYGIDTPERGQRNYVEARAFAEGYAPVGATVVVKTFKTPEKFGRFLALVYVGKISVNDLLVESGLATVYGATS
jgi:micrococcal nuclease